ADEEIECNSDDLARAVVVVNRVEAMLAGRMIEHGEIDPSLPSSAYVGVRALEQRRTVAAGAGEKKRREVQRFGLEGGETGPSADVMVGRRSNAPPVRRQIPHRVEAGRAPKPIGRLLEERRKTEGPARREDPDADPISVDREIFSAVSDK